MPKHSSGVSRTAGVANGPSGFWIDRLSLLWVTAIVIARCTLQETLRDPLEVLPGAPGPPRSVGPSATMVLNLLACVPAILLIVRSALSRRPAVKPHWAGRVAAALSCWMALSVLWADDQFAAIVGASTFIAAAGVLWTVSNCLRTWGDIRFIGSVLIGLLFVLVGQGLQHRYIETPEVLRDWREHREQLLRDRGLEPGSFGARQFEKRVFSDELMGFTASPNSFAAVLALLTLVALGLAVQRRADRDSLMWQVVPIIVIAGSVWTIVQTQSRTGIATPMLGACLLLVVYILRRWLSRHAAWAYGAGVAIVAAIASAVIVQGVTHGTLFHISLTFRWLYWIGAARLFALHPVLGVGWANFGPHYLAHRVPFPPEEIRDPHNFIVRFFVELGIIGGCLAIAWMLRLWWEMTRPVSPPATPTGRRFSLKTVCGFAVAATVLNVCTSIDFQQAGAYFALEVISRGGGLVLFLAGVFLTGATTLSDAAIDDRPAPWILYALVVAAGIFLVHNLIDFSLFEAGPMFLFALVVGTILGARRETTTLASTNAVWRWAACSVTLAGFLTASIFTLRLLIAQQVASSADDDLRAGQSARAAAGFRQASGTLPINADFAFREARALVLAGAPADTADSALARAVAADPSSALYHATRARLWLRQPAPSADRIRDEFSKALALDPRDVQMRLEFADALGDLGLFASAVEEYNRALNFDSQMPVEEEKRLSSDKTREIGEKIQRLNAKVESGPSTAPVSR